MSGTTPDRTSPDHDWTGNSSSASNDDVADAIAHVKAWAMREIETLKADFARPAAPSPVSTSAPAPVYTPPVFPPSTSGGDTTDKISSVSGSSV